MPHSDEEIARCFIHQNEDPKPVVFMHEHHRSPKAWGGGNEDDNLVWLCSGCHDIVHRLATFTMSGKGGLAQDYLELYLPYDLRARERVKELVQEVIQTRAAFDDKALSADDTVLLTLKIPRTLHSMLKTLSMDKVRPNGRKFGLAAYAISILKNHVMQQMYGHHPDTQDVAKSPSNQDLLDLHRSTPSQLKRFRG